MPQMISKKLRLLLQFERSRSLQELRSKITRVSQKARAAGANQRRVKLASLLLAIALAHLPSNTSAQPSKPELSTAPQPTPSDASKSTATSLRKHLFAGRIASPGCLPIARALQSGSTSVSPTLTTFINTLKSALKMGDSTALLPLFHPRIVTNLAPVDSLLASMKLTLGRPFEVSTFKLWAINTVDGSPDPVTCGGLEHTNLKFWPQFGYNLEFALWIQVLGKAELGRIFVTIVEKDDRWYIGALHYHQWTHTSKDYEHWFLSGKEDLNNKLPHAAFVKFDIASKLVDGQKQFRLGIHQELDDFKSNMLTAEKWKSDIKVILEKWKILHMSTILAENGAGIIFRFEIPAEISTNELVADCHSAGTTLKNHAWFQKIDGIKCSYVIKGENPAREGRLGGIYIKQESIITRQHPTAPSPK